MDITLSPYFKKIEHIGIAVKDIKSSNQLYEMLFGVKSYKQEIVESENVLTSFFKIGENKIELIADINEGTTVSKFIEKRGEGIHHIAYEVENIEAEMLRLSEAGFKLLSEKPKRGADNKLICFLHPKSSQGVLIELCQEIQ